MAGRFFVSLLVVAVFTLSAGAIGAQGTPPQNLKVLPKDISREELNGIMRGFTMALGVNCRYCHMERETPAGAVAPPGGRGGRGQAPLNYAADGKPTKEKARFMLRMTDSLNRVVLAALPDRHDPAIDVTCVTCHRGVSVPITMEMLLLDVATKRGADSAVANYRTLRADMASGRYNFSEGPVTDVAARLSRQGKSDDAITLLQGLQEFFPNSANIDYQLAELYLAKGDREQGIARLRAVLTKNPNDPRARQRLQQLGASPQ